MPWGWIWKNKKWKKIIVYSYFNTNLISDGKINTQYMCSRVSWELSEVRYINSQVIHSTSASTHIPLFDEKKKTLIQPISTICSSVVVVPFDYWWYTKLWI